MGVDLFNNQLILISLSGLKPLNYYSYSLNQRFLACDIWMKEQRCADSGLECNGIYHCSVNI